MEEDETADDDTSNSSNDEDGDLESLVSEEADEDTEDDEDSNKDILVFFHEASQHIETDIRACFEIIRLEIWRNAIPEADEA